MEALPRRVVCCVALVATLGVAAASAAAGPTWSGRWRLTNIPIRDGAGTMTLVQKGSTVTGRFPWQLYSDKGFGSSGYCYTGKGGTIKGTVRGRALTGVLVFPAGDGHPRSTAPFRATLSANGRRFEANGEVTSGECSTVAVYLSFTGARIG